MQQKSMQESMQGYKQDLVLLGSPLRNWILLSMYILCSRLVPTLVLGAMYYGCLGWEGAAMKVLRLSEVWVKSDSICYYASCLTDGVITICYFSLLLMIWLLHFAHKRPHDQTKTTFPALPYLTWTIVSLLIASVLFFIKDALISMWIAQRIYRKFRTRIVRSGFQLYFLAYICGFRLPVLEPANKETILLINQNSGVDHEMNIEEFVRMKMKNHVVSKQANLFDLQDMARCFLDMSLLASSNGGDHKDEDVGELINICETILTPTPAAPLDHTQTTELDHPQTTEHHNTQKETRLMFILTVSLKLGYTLLDANELVNYLNRILSFAIIIVVILAWLLLSEVATTRVLVVIASPIVAATFIFGDMCKKAFEGFMFTFVSCPIAIGDKCLIDGIKLEVKRMGVMRTKFWRAETSDDFSYSNSELASKAIINIGGDMSTDDQVELSLDASTMTSTSIQTLKDKIESFLKHNRDRFSSDCEFIVTEIKNNVNITVGYKHLVQGQDVTVSKWLEKKRSQRSVFLTAVVQILKEAEISCATAR